MTEDNAEYKAFVALKNDLAELLSYSTSSTANYAYAADLIDDDVHKKVFSRDPKSDTFKVMYLIASVRDSIKAASPEGARKKMSDFLECLADPVFSDLTKYLEDKVSKLKENPLKKKNPEFHALKDPKIVLLAAGSVLSVATHAQAKGLIKHAEYQYIISSGNENRMFTLTLLDMIGTQIQEDPEVLETFITEVLDEIGPPVSALGEKLRKLADPTAGQTR